MTKHWTGDEHATLCTYGTTESFNELMKRLPGRTKAAIKCKRSKMGITYNWKVLIPIIRDVDDSVTAKDIVNNYDGYHILAGVVRAITG